MLPGGYCATLKKYHDKGLHICAWINPYIAQGTAFFKEGAANGYLLQRADGKGIADRQLAGRYGPCGLYQPGCG